MQLCCSQSAFVLLVRVSFGLYNRPKTDFILQLWGGASLAILGLGTMRVRRTAVKGLQQMTAISPVRSAKYLKAPACNCVAVKKFVCKLLFF